MIFDDADLEGDAVIDQGLGQSLRLGGGERVEVSFRPLRRLLREVNGAPVGAVEDAGGADVEEDHGVPGAEVVFDRPSHGIRTLIAQIDGDHDAALILHDRGILELPGMEISAL